MIIKRILLRWLIMTLKYFVVNVVVAGVFDMLVFRPLEAWLGMGETDDMEDMEDTEDVGAMENVGDPFGGDSGLTEG